VVIYLAWILLALAVPAVTCAQNVDMAEAPEASRPADAAESPAHEALDEAYRLKAEHALGAARAAFERALREGANAQVVWWELGTLSVEQHDARDAREAFQHCASGSDPQLAREAQAELARLDGMQSATSEGAGSASTSIVPCATCASNGESAEAWLAKAYAFRAARDFPHAQSAFLAAARAGADPQLIALERAYVAIEQGDRALARAEFTSAARGPDAARTRQAESELAALASREPRHFWADLYAEAFGWKRIVGANHEADLVPTARLRGFYRPFSGLDVHLYLFAQATRDVASRTADRAGVPLIYADNTAIFGPGILWRLWSQKLGLYAQIGPAIELVDHSKKRVQLDARVGATLGLESGGCWPAALSGSRWQLSTCQDLYAEVTYASRYQNDVIGYARGRTALGFAITGPVQWLIGAELRAAKDTNEEYYNNFADAGLGPRIRLLSPFHLDLTFAAHAGTYFGESHLDPAPHPLHYVDLRAQAATYVEF
jgi:hypothetical protein